jgi:ABC-type transport system involved in cytochrome c biogenesis ATPase subunit
MQTLLTLEKLTVSRGSHLLAQDVTRTLKAGDVLLLVGPNGSGKTSFLRAVTGLLTPASGHVARASHFHFLPAQHLAPSLETPRQYLTYQASLMDVPFSLNLHDDAFGVARHLDTPLNRLSTGWRQRVKLTRLMLDPRDLWFLDEPADGLDAAGETVLQNLIRDHKGAVVIATHDPHLWPTAQTQMFGGES